ncbi:Niemann-Pick C1 protein [Eurytemora carolleeae]|uniref:Niemann-Pick C1 protein n=1 Tax=Eurytemora carolleeae TaxID=1294199 RepID=UPI000C75A51D|nr:Niemann-Pick C1 protein [Eurytemora carolleeae]|eukprot:XP_023328081.1 Niemann-Pick C1 protein-like [Eurytemora affinis]
MSDKRDPKTIVKKRKKMWFENFSFELISETIVHSMELFFYWYGSILARYPIRSICLTLVIPGLCAIGLLRLEQENNPYKLWIPQDSDYIRNHEWLWQNFPDDIRFHSVILTGDNVLTPEYIRKLYEVHEAMVNVTSSKGERWSDICYRVPMVDLEPIQDLLNDSLYEYEDYEDDVEEIPETTEQIQDGGSETTADSMFDITTQISVIDNSTLISSNNSENRIKRASEFDPAIDLYPEDYCPLIEDLTTSICLENSLLELWGKAGYTQETKDIIYALTQEDILRAINTVTTSPVYDRAQDFSKYLGDISRNSSGHIIGARAMFLRFFGQVNTTALTDSEDVAVTKGSPVDGNTLAWEDAIIDVLSKLADGDSSLVFNVAKSFSDLSAGAIYGDALLFGIGTSTVFVYVQIMLGKFNFVQTRPGLSSVGLGCYGLAILTSYGFCSGIGLVFSPLHSVIPFLIMGLGVDDMFVIMQSLDNLDAKGGTALWSIERKIAETMKLGGVAITITSFTDLIAFAIGAITVLPALKSFCLFCAVGIASVYFYTATIFVAFLSIDERRIRAKRNGMCPLIVHKDWTPNKISQREFGRELFEKLGWVLSNPFVQAFVLIATAVLGGFGIYGLSELKQEFNPIKFIPPESYLAGWFHANTEYFPKEGERVIVNIGDIDYNNELHKLENLVGALVNETEILSAVDSWYLEFRKFAVGKNLVEESDWFNLFQENREKFYTILTQFLFSPDGAPYRRRFNFVNDLICGEAAPTVLLSSIELTHRLFTSPSEWIPAMNRIKELVREANFSSRAFPTGTEYASWETDEVIGYELYQNMGISLLCVFLTVLLLIASIRACLLVLVCVVLSLVNVAGYMHFWGLTVDVISCVNLEIAIGLTVDYSAHVAHTFLIQKGSKSERMRSTLTEIGPAVLNGGFSTFLAFIFTVGSKSHVFISFFRIFMLVVLFGLYHGLIFLPVALALIGPEPHQKRKEDDDEMNTEEGKISTIGRRASKENQVAASINYAFSSKEEFQLKPVNTEIEVYAYHQRNSMCDTKAKSVDKNDATSIKTESLSAADLPSSSENPSRADPLTKTNSPSPADSPMTSDSPSTPDSPITADSLLTADPQKKI